MFERIEKTPDGSDVLWHEARIVRGPAAYDPVLAANVEAFMRARVGEVTSVIHEVESRFVHIDIHLIPPGPGRDLWVLFTTGMAAMPMTLPPATCSCARIERAELVMGLPADWFTEADLACGGRVAAKRSWPTRMLTQIARLPHECATWLDVGHTVPNGDPPKRWATDRRFTGAILLPPVGILDVPAVVRTRDTPTIQLLTPVPLHTAEMDFKLKHGLDAMLELFDQRGVSGVLDPGRQSVVG